MQCLHLSTLLALLLCNAIFTHHYQNEVFSKLVQAAALVGLAVHYM